MSFKKKSVHKGNGKRFIIFPIAFFILGYVILYAAFSPILKPTASMVNMLFLNTEPNFDKEAADIYARAASSAAGKTNESSQVKLSSIDFPSYGDIFGHISIPGTSVNADLYYGDGNTELNNGVGVYMGGLIPGYGGTTLLAGHNNTFFHTLGNAQAGDSININTHYGNYVYEITETKVANEKDKSAYDLLKKEENIILYTCYPFDCVGLTPQRYFVYAKYVSGPMLDTKN